MTAARQPKYRLAKDLPIPSRLNSSNSATACTSQGMMTGTFMRVGKALFHFRDIRRRAMEAVMPSTAALVLTRILNHSEYQVAESKSAD